VQDCVAASVARTSVSLGDQVDGPAVDDSSFEEFVAGNSVRLFTVALLLTGRHRPEAEDLLQDVLERAYRRWGRITRHGDPEPYVRKMLINAAVDRSRRLLRRREEPLLADSADVTAGDQVGAAGDRDLLLRVLAGLPRRQRAVLVLRFFEDLSEAQAAVVLGCSVGAVKSQTSRGLAKLRQVILPAGSGRPAQSSGPPADQLQKNGGN
jgi:RNA polymerase sigma-70 factor (sigma-E family)